MRIITLGSMLLATVLTMSQANAQKVKKAAAAPVATTDKVDINKVFKDWKPRNIGPASMSGRVTTIDAEVANPNHIWIGAASGGVWKTSNAGVSWTPVFDEQPILNIGALAIQQSNPSVVWVGTGEGNPRNSVSLGEGIYKSLDGGKTWKCMGLEKTRNIHRIIIDPTNPDVVYAGVIGNPFVPHPERGLYKTTDGGQSWKLILHTNDTSGVGDMVMDPVNPNKLVTGHDGGLRLFGRSARVVVDAAQRLQRFRHRPAAPAGFCFPQRGQLRLQGGGGLLHHRALGQFQNDQ